MSRSTLIALLLIGLSLGMLSASCGERAASRPGSGTATHAAPAPPRPGCLAGTGARHRSVGGHPPVDTYAIGRSPVVVIASNESDEELCSWVPFAERLAAHHLQVLLYDYTVSDVGDLARVLRSVRRSGAHRIELLGASEGAKTSIVVGAEHPGAVSAVVSLSAEEFLDGNDVERSARRLHAPVLYATARRDVYGATEASRLFARVTPVHDKRLRTVRGSDHGTALLRHQSMAWQVQRFLVNHSR